MTRPPPADLVVPPRPGLIDALMREREKEDPDFHLIEKQIASDIGVSGALLKVANSPLLGSARRLTSVREAMQALGMRQVIALASGLVLRHLMKGGDTGSMERFWDTTDHVASLCGLLSRRFRIPDVDQTMTYGLFHDCGIPLLMTRYRNYKDVLRAANAQPNRPFIDVEDELLDTNHAVVGNILAKNWGLPAPLCDAILNHHDLEYFLVSKGADNGVTKTLVAVGHFAEHLHHLSKRGSIDMEWSTFGDHVLRHFGLSSDDYEDLVAEFNAG